MEVTQIVLYVCLIPLAFLIFKFPELGLVLCLVVGSLFKGMVQPLLGPVDITAYLFVVTFGSILIRGAMEKNLPMPGLAINISILLLLALLLASLLYTPLPRQGFETFLQLTFLSVSLLYATFIWCNNIDRIKRLLFIFACVLLAYGLVALIWVLVLGNVSGSRAPFPGTPVLGIAQYLAVGILVAFILREFVSGKFKRLALSLLIIAGIVELIALNSRGPLIAFLAGAVCLFFLYSGREKRRVIVLSTAIVTVLILTFILLPSQYTSRYAFITSPESTSIAWRLDAWHYVIQHFPDWFFGGAGISSFSYYYAGTIDPLAPVVYPHNIFLDIFANVGFFGFLILFWIIGYLFYKGVKMARMSGSAIRHFGLAATAALTVFVIEYLFSGTITSRGLWFFGGLILALERISKKEPLGPILRVKE
jgi:O-antigen ligase